MSPGEKAETPKKEEPVKGRRAGRQKLALWILGPPAVLAAAAGLLFFFAPHLASQGLELAGLKEAGGGKETVRPPGHIYKLEPFVVNLADVHPARYLKIRIDLESTRAQESPDFLQRLPRLRDAVLSILGRKKSFELYGAEGKEKLREEIVAQLNGLTGETKLRTAYFIEFIIQ